MDMCRPDDRFHFSRSREFHPTRRLVCWRVRWHLGLLLLGLQVMSVIPSASEPALAAAGTESVEITRLAGEESDPGAAPPGSKFQRDAMATLTRRLLAFTGLVCLGAVVWAAFLQRRARHQTQLLRQRVEREMVLEQRYRTLFESSKDILLTINLHGRINAVNSEAERLTGFTRAAARAADMNLRQCVTVSM